MIVSFVRCLNETLPPIIIDRFSEIPVELVRSFVVREINMYPNAPVGSLGVVRRCKEAAGACEGRRISEVALFERGVEDFHVEQDRLGVRGLVGAQRE
jgi:hypothetical protein